MFIECHLPGDVLYACKTINLRAIPFSSDHVLGPTLGIVPPGLQMQVNRGKDAIKSIHGVGSQSGKPIDAIWANVHVNREVPIDLTQC